MRYADRQIFRIESIDDKRTRRALIEAICAKLQISIPIRRSSELLDRAALGSMDPTERLIQLCRAVGATRYLSGPAARSYLESHRFEESAIEVVWMDYCGYPDYPQLWGRFEPKVSIVDLLLNTGDEAEIYLNKSSDLPVNGAT